MSNAYRIRRAMRLLISGPPSVGKSRQGRLLSEELGLPHVSSGDLIRAAAAAGDRMAQRLLGIVSDGSLAPSEEITRIVLDRLAHPDCDEGFILDGFPRRWMEAEALVEHHHIDALFVLEADESILMSRLVARARQGRTDDDPANLPRRIHTFNTEGRRAHDVFRLMHVPVHHVDAAGGWIDVSSQIMDRLPYTYAAPQAA